VPSFAQVFYSLLVHGSLARDNEESHVTLNAAAGRINFLLLRRNTLAAQNKQPLETADEVKQLQFVTVETEKQRQGVEWVYGVRLKSRTRAWPASSRTSTC
jgi:hypothetical protein